MAIISFQRLSRIKLMSRYWNKLSRLREWWSAGLALMKAVLLSFGRKLNTIGITRRSVALKRIGNSYRKLILKKSRLIPSIATKP